MRVVIADDVMLVREGIAHVLREAGIDVIAQTSDATALMGEIVSRQPDIAIVDIRMPPTHTDEGLVAATRMGPPEPDHVAEEQLERWSVGHSPERIRGAAGHDRL